MDESLLLESEVCERARQSRDRRFDGRFYVAVTSTGIFCRPICPAPTPRADRVRFYATAAAASAAGFRPCLRCRPEAAPGSDAWRGTSSTVARAMRLIERGELEFATVESLAGRLEVTARHLTRLFQRHLGATPGDVLRTQRLLAAKRLIDESDLRLADVAFEAGFGSVRQFNTAVRSVYGRPPRELRRGAERPSGSAASVTLRLAYRPPLQAGALFGYLRARAIPGLESVEDGIYRRAVPLGDRVGRIAVRPDAGRHALLLEVEGAPPRGLLRISAACRRLFDLDSDPTEIESWLCRDRWLRPIVRKAAGLRLPGAWDGFEFAVRAILGQQVSVAGASTLTGRLVERWGREVEAGEGLTRLFPDPADVAVAQVEEVGVPGTRAEAIRRLAAEVDSGALELDTTVDVDATRTFLRSLPGIGPWTAEIIALRVLGDPDAFPAGDLGLRQAAATDGRKPSARSLEERAEAWRPWRGYAAMHLWNSL